MTQWKNWHIVQWGYIILQHTIINSSLIYWQSLKGVKAITAGPSLSGVVSEWVVRRKVKRQVAGGIEEGQVCSGVNRLISHFSIIMTNRRKSLAEKMDTLVRKRKNK